MKKIGSFIILLLVSLITYGQTFEGKVKFKNTFKSKSQQVADEQLAAMLGVNSPACSMPSERADRMALRMMRRNTYP